MKQDVSSNEIVDELEEAKRLLNEADSKLDEAAKIFCSVLHGKNVCYKECPAFTEGWTQCYIEDSSSNIDMISEKIDCLLKSCGEKEGEMMTEKNVDELKKKVLELRYMVDKKDGEIEKYQRALRVAGDDIAEMKERCNACQLIYSCTRENKTELDCKRAFIEGWKEKAGIE